MGQKNKNILTVNLKSIDSQMKIYFEPYGDDLILNPGDSSIVYFSSDIRPNIVFDAFSEGEIRGISFHPESDYWIPSWPGEKDYYGSGSRDLSNGSIDWNLIFENSMDEIVNIYDNKNYFKETIPISESRNRNININRMRVLECSFSGFFIGGNPGINFYYS